ncbi:hypothetical protein N9L68_00500 [bacterium]|nr:hypothetical protein [bacterium]
MVVTEGRQGACPLRKNSSGGDREDEDGSGRRMEVLARQIAATKRKASGEGSCLRSCGGRRHGTDENTKAQTYTPCLLYNHYCRPRHVMAPT